jgi:hypothetical protein
MLWAAESTNIIKHLVAAKPSKTLFCGRKMKKIDFCCAMQPEAID